MGILILSPHLNRRISIVGVEFSRWGKLGCADSAQKKQNDNKQKFILRAEVDFLCTQASCDQQACAYAPLKFTGLCGFAQLNSTRCKQMFYGISWLSHTGTKVLILYLY